MGNRVRRVLHSGDPRGVDYREARNKIISIRSRLSQIRSELEDVGKIEARFPHDRMCSKVAGTLTLTLVALYPLIDKFEEGAEALDSLWANAASDPEGYLIKEGETWRWRPR